MSQSGGFIHNSSSGIASDQDWRIVKNSKETMLEKARALSEAVKNPQTTKEEVYQAIQELSPEVKGLSGADGVNGKRPVARRSRSNNDGGLTPSSQVVSNDDQLQDFKETIYRTIESSEWDFWTLKALSYETKISPQKLRQILETDSKIRKSLSSAVRNETLYTLKSNPVRLREHVSLISSMFSELIS